MAAYRVLVVEDNEDLRELTTVVLGLAGYAVATAANGSEALRFLAGNPPPDIMLLDLQMPVMDGLEFLRIARNYDGLARIPILVVSTDPERVLHQRDKSSNIAGLLKKPVAPRKLVAQVARTIAEWQSRYHCPRVAAFAT